tara:strand:+ start:1670 stop:1972 length:303 start_codon:yes stop_codon:yes gene_type:complete
MGETIATALKANLIAELSALGEEATFKGFIIKVLVGTTKETKAMRAAGYYQNEAINMVMAPGENAPGVNDVLIFRAKNYRITEVENLEYNHGYNLTLELK